jgi:hypothetical protein
MVFFVQAYQNSQYVVPCGGIFLVKWRSSFRRSSDCKMNAQPACALNIRYNAREYTHKEISVLTVPPTDKWDSQRLHPISKRKLSLVGKGDTHLSLQNTWLSCVLYLPTISSFPVLSMTETRNFAADCWPITDKGEGVCLFVNRYLSSCLTRLLRYIKALHQLHMFTGVER